MIHITIINDLFSFFSRYSNVDAIGARSNYLPIGAK